MESNVKLISLIAFAALIGVVIYLTVNRMVFATNPVFIAIQVLAVLLMVWARITFGTRSFHAAANPTAGGLVTNGPYRYIRHPIYAAILFFFGATLVDHWSVLNGAILMIVVGALLARALSEEQLIRMRYPEYVDYALRTKRFVPDVW